MMVNVNNFEICACCNRPIRAGHPFIVCKNCDTIMHNRCRTPENVIKFRDNMYCKKCIDQNDIIRYNPFYQAPHFDNNGLLDDEPINFIESLRTSSNILESCNSYSIQELNSRILCDDNRFSTCFLNIDGNSSNFDNFSIDLARIDHNFSVIGIAETNTDSVNGALYQLKNYNSIYQSRYFIKDRNQYKTKGTGVALYIHDTLNSSKIDDLSLCEENIESLFVTITNTEEPTVVGVIYRPPNSSLEEFNTKYEQILSKLSDKKSYILGDYNVNLLDISPGTSEDNFQEIVFANGFTPTVSIPTHEMPGCKKTCIDNIHTNDIDCSTLAGVITDKISHHHMVFLSRDPIRNSQTSALLNKVTIHYDYSRANLEKLCDEIENDIDRIYNSSATFESFLALYQEKIDLSCKLSTPKTTKRNSMTNPWITEGLINSVAKKARLYFEWKKSCTLELPEGDRAKFNTNDAYQKSLKRTIKSAKALFYANKFDECNRNSKKTWQLINELRGKTKAQTKDDFVIDGQRVTCRRTIANKFNEYFTSLASNLNAAVMSSESTQIEPLPSFSQFMLSSRSSSIYLEDTHAQEIVDIVKEFQNGKASDIPIVVVKKTVHLISPILAKLYNKCMLDGTFPSEFKTAKVTPIFKKSNKELIENYRPVSILPIFGKIFEKIIYKRLYAFFLSKGILKNEQFGFRKGHSTTHALHKSTESIKNNLENGKHVLGIFIDLSKAFDTLDHRILLSKLETYGIRGVALSLMKSYLTGRDQYVSFNSTASDTLGIRYGVPQGSILGPLLFLLYMNDITNCCDDPNVQFVLYADDTNIFVVGPSQEATYLRANKVLEKVSIFMKCNLLHINMSKWNQGGSSFTDEKLSHWQGPICVI